MVNQLHNKDAPGARAFDISDKIFLNETLAL
jgi:hypothetical protein